VIRLSRHVEATPEEVWAVLSDGWLYPLWVVGASRIRDVDADWPAVGSRIHHSVGPWPLVINDHTEVLEVRPGTALTLRARGWPLGEAMVKVSLEPSGSGTQVTLEEDVISGPGRLTPRPVRAPLLRWRNTESLERFAPLVERRA
jgi:uncharacterized protein YndB with AHSA1/START domain